MLKVTPVKSGLLETLKVVFSGVLDKSSAPVILQLYASKVVAALPVALNAILVKSGLLRTEKVVLIGTLARFKAPVKLQP